MNFLVIAPINGTRHFPLIAQLNSLGDHEVHLVDAVMLQALPADFNKERSHAMIARTPTPGEVGCATSHREAWKRFLMSADEWTCVVEDDARVTDESGLQTILAAATSASLTSPTVVSLFSEGSVLAERPGPYWARCRFEPPGTVGYVINRAAAKALSAANQDGVYLADWPRSSGVTFHLATQHIIGHGDDSTESLIGTARFSHPRSTQLGPRLETATKILQRLALYSLAHYLRNRQHFNSPVHYCQIVLNHRVMWHLGRLAGRCIDAERRVYVLSWRCNRLVDFLANPR